MHFFAFFPLFQNIKPCKNFKLCTSPAVCLGRRSWQKKKQLVVAKERVGIPPPEEVLPLPSVSQPKKHRDWKHRSHSHCLRAPGTSRHPRPCITAFIRAQYSRPSMREHNSCLKDQSAPSCAPLLYRNSVSGRHANPFLTIVQSALDSSTTTPLWSCSMLRARCHFAVSQNKIAFSPPFCLAAALKGQMHTDERCVTSCLPNTAAIVEI